jgi:hypothetical protein
MTEAGFGPWRRSSYSGSESCCIELAWRTSSYSGNEGNCVELAHSGTSGAVRDSKNPEGGHLHVSFAGLIALAKSQPSR